MKLSELMARYPENARIAGDAHTEVRSLCTDSRKLCEGCLFFCVVGLHTDAHIFAPEAKARGAAALVVERELPVDLPQIIVGDARFAMSYIAQAFYGYPADRLRLIGITGTKGKTTTSYLVKSILERAGYRVGLIGTVCTLIGDEQLAAGKTTPDPVEFQELLLRMADASIDYVIMEVSAHALSMHRIAGVRFEIAAFTNLSQDHLDFYGTMDKYLEAKMQILTYTDRLVVNVDDETVLEAMNQSGRLFRRVGIRERADIYARNIDFAEDGIRFELCYHKRFSFLTHLCVSGIFNVYNALIAAALCAELDIDERAIKAGLERVQSIPGRIELLETHTPFRVILDYAHSPDALENILTTLREMTHGRLIALFGCGGGRDHMKRPVMGEIGGRLADICILTSDNPRDEDPMSIIDAVEEGIRATGAEYVVIENRRAAIKYALDIAREGDVVVLAGKGHETYQEIMGVKHPFDEKRVVMELIKELKVRA